MRQQAIQVKFYPATNTKGECFRARCLGGSLVFPFNNEHDHDANEILAAEALLVKMGWHLKNKLSDAGALPNDLTVFTLIERDQYLCGNPDCGQEIEIVGTWKYGQNGAPLWDAQVCKACAAWIVPARLMGMTTEQWSSLREMYAINPDGADDFGEFARRASLEVGYKDVFMIRWQNMTVGIEPDGYRHT